MPPDLRALDAASFEQLIFDHPAYEGQEFELDGDRIVRRLETRPTEWYWNVEWNWSDVPSDPLHTLDLVTRLFEDASALPEKYTLRQIAQGFNLVVGPAAADPFVYPLWNSALPWEPRRRLIHAVLPLYERLFDVEVGIEHVPFMLWDSLLGYRYRGGPAIPASNDDERVQTEVAEVIAEQLLTLDGPWSAPSALHGAYHVNHPVADAAVERWMTAHGDTADDWVNYAARVLRGAAM